MALPKTQEEEEKRMEFLAANSHYFLPHHAVHPGCTMQCPVCAWFQHAKQLILVTALTHQPEERQTTQALLTSRYSPPAGATSGDGAVLEQALVDNPELSEEAASTTPWQGLLETHRGGCYSATSIKAWWYIVVTFLLVTPLKPFPRAQIQTVLSLTKILMLK